MASITLEELHTYHAIDREIFSRLVISLLRDPAESLLVMATWLWLEDKGCPNMIAKMIGLSNLLVNALADEAVLCLKCLESSTLSMLSNGGNSIPLTARIMEKNISLEMFYHDKFSAISGIKNFLTTVCARIFTDILQHVTATTSTPAEGPLVIPGFPHPIFGNVTVTPRSLDFNYPAGGLWGWGPNNNVSEDERTMFLTFSRGFPVTIEEVTELFSRLHGACVVSVQMQENLPPNEQPLFARMVLDSTTAVDRILNGRRIAKFRINGKHIWARKYERRD
ncbi:uncharacterized protein LOC8259466 [Ricinus communis]|uniref:RRM domain-containing protein n=1 Tax=Ricinus communis TaxID=3988 RepID=B9RP59_RICCO|nr:uncharacterized protein LOC8259466 [Ricinus communis]EEF46977.1 conserved hypothetical protein [Ricinus communis]|eukprot:XP_002515528.1 uncharacterized protein LOC8259466 [Ricinus communis]